MLEVVESFRDKYLSTAKNVSAPLLIAALNILNETEINYKAARNKRLHVELALIKLCYLQQAIEITAEGNAISKKKLIDTTKPLAFRSIKPFIPDTSKISKGNTEGAAKLVIETPAISSVQEPETSYKQPESMPDRQAGSNQSGDQPATGKKLTALNKIRQQYQNNGNSGNTINHPLQKEELQKAWADYVVKLKEAKNPAAQPFELAVLRIRDDNSFEAVTANSIEKQFIEQDRNKLFVYLRERLQNRLLQFSVAVEENAESRPVIEIPLSSSEQYNKMAEQYPLVKELKDKLNLTLDY